MDTGICCPQPLQKRAASSFWCPHEGTERHRGEPPYGKNVGLLRESCHRQKQAVGGAMRPIACRWLVSECPWVGFRGANAFLPVGRAKVKSQVKRSRSGRCYGLSVPSIGRSVLRHL